MSIRKMITTFCTKIDHQDDTFPLSSFDMKNIYFHYLSILVLLTLVFGGFGSALYLLIDGNRGIDEPLKVSAEKLEPRAKIESSAKKELLASKEPTVNLEPLATIEISVTTKPPATKEQSTNLELSEKIEPSVNIKPLVESLLEPLANIKPITKIEPANIYLSASRDILANIEQSTNIEPLAEIEPLAAALSKPSNETLIQSAPPITESFNQPFVQRNSSFHNQLAVQAELRLQSNVTYDGSYLKIGYPLGDVPAHIGVCTDVVIRSFRGLGVDLQQRVHEDMKRNFRSYPSNWQLTRPDSNIDHRRVPNLMTYFKRAGASLRITSNPSDYYAGDVVAWDLGGGLTHIGIVSSYVSELTGNPLIVHNIGVGPEMNDILFSRKIIGHYKYGDNQYEGSLVQN